jgi:tRNA threonylcarbamoyladenosine modification (KEOPS) complex  Pcc1 subunit
MSAAYFDFKIEQGATFYQPLVWKDGNGALVNLTGYTARMQIRKTVKSDTTILSLTTENGRITLGGAAGTILLQVSATDTAALVACCGVYDLELQASNGNVVRLLEGEIEISKEVTR